MRFRACRALICALALSACQTAPSPDLKVVVSALPTTLDQSISHASSWANYPVMLATLKGLTSLSPDGKEQPGLAERWERERTHDGHERYRFHLRRDVVWSDGRTPLTANDFVFAWRRALTGEERGELSEILGAEQALKVQAQGAPPEVVQRALEQVSVFAPDPHTFEVVLEKPRRYFLSRLANVYLFFPAPSADLKGRTEAQIREYFDRPQNGRPLALGPWRVEKWDRSGERLTLVRNPFSSFLPTLASGEAPVERVMLLRSEVGAALFERGRVAFVTLDDASALRRRPLRSITKVPLLSTYFLAINTERPPLNRPEMRRAIADALNREELLRGLLPNVRVSSRLVPEELLSPRFTPLSTPSLGERKQAPREKSPLPHREPAAVGGRCGGRLWPLDCAQRVGVRQGAPEVTHPLRLVFRATDSFLPETAIAERIRDQLERAGFEVELAPRHDFAEEVARVAADGFPAPDLYLRRLGADYAHPNTFFTLFERSGNHHTGWEKLEGGTAMARFEALLEEADASVEPPRTSDPMDLYRRAESILLDEQVVLIPLFHPDRYYQVRPDLVGLSMDAFNFLSFEKLRRRSLGP